MESTPIKVPVGKAVARSLPYALFGQWFAEAKTNELDKLHPNAIALATCSASGFPSVRMVLMQHYDERGFCFYTNYNSRKGEELLSNLKASIVFFWKGMQRQVRVEGHVEQVSKEEADAYHSTRPRGSQLGAWASNQSHPYSDPDYGKQELVDRVKEMDAKFPESAGPVPRPPHWSGFRIVPTRFEFWQEGEYRYHSRDVFDKIVAQEGKKGAEASEEEYWKTCQLFP